MKIDQRADIAAKVFEEEFIKEYRKEKKNLRHITPNSLRKRIARRHAATTAADRAVAVATHADNSWGY